MNPQMNLYLVWQTVNNDYDTYDSIVVAAPDEETAKSRELAPCSCEPEYDKIPEKRQDYRDRYGHNRYCSWARTEYLECKLIGFTQEYLKPVIILKSFNAG